MMWTSEPPHWLALTSVDRSAPHVHDRDIVRVDALPFAHAVEQAYRRRRWIEQRRVDAVVVQQMHEVADVLQVAAAIIAEQQPIGVELIGTAIDERLHARIDEVTAEFVIVENGAGVARLDGIDRGDRPDLRTRRPSARAGEYARQRDQTRHQRPGGEAARWRGC